MSTPAGFSAFQTPSFRRSASSSSSTRRRVRTGAVTYWNDVSPARARRHSSRRRTRIQSRHRRACQSTPFNVRTEVKRRDEFWLKTRPYSLQDLLAVDDDILDEFVSGTLCQAFLSASN